MKTSRCLLGLLLVGGCSTVPSVGIDGLKTGMDGQRISVRGELRVSGFPGMPYFHLCPTDSGDDFSRCLDLIIPEREESRHVAGDRRCAIALGQFIAFGDDTIGMGYLRSDIGMLEDASVGTCD